MVACKVDLRSLGFDYWWSRSSVSQFNIYALPIIIPCRDESILLNIYALPILIPYQDGRSNDGAEFVGDDEVLETQLPLNLPSQSGEILFCGATNWDMLSGGTKNVKNMRNIWNISRLHPLQGCFPRDADCAVNFVFES